MKSTSQLNLPPMGVKEVANVVATPSKVLGSTPLVDVAFRAFARCGLNSQQAAAALDTSPANFSRAFSVNWPENNPLMKKWDTLPFEVRREFAALLAADYGLSQPDAEQTRVVRDFARLLRAVGE
jgi:hypothetical protein